MRPLLLRTRLCVCCVPELVREVNSITGSSGSGMKTAPLDGGIESLAKTGHSLASSHMLLVYSETGRILQMEKRDKSDQRHHHES